MGDLDVTELLERWGDGDSSAGDRVMELLYDEVRGIAAREFRRERVGHTLQATALANEAFMRMARGQMRAENRLHFLALTARVIRQVLVDHSRDRGRAKRGGDWMRIEIAGIQESVEQSGVVFVDLDRALKMLAELDKTAAEVVELKFIGGLTIDEIATYLEISAATVARKWMFARTWLRAELAKDQEVD